MQLKILLARPQILPAFVKQEWVMITQGINKRICIIVDKSSAHTSSHIWREANRVDISGDKETFGLFYSGWQCVNRATVQGLDWVYSS